MKQQGHVLERSWTRDPKHTMLLLQDAARQQFLKIHYILFHNCLSKAHFFFNKWQKRNNTNVKLLESIMLIKIIKKRQLLECNKALIEAKSYVQMKYTDNNAMIQRHLVSFSQFLNSILRDSDGQMSCIKNLVWLISLTFWCTPSWWSYLFLLIWKCLLWHT